MLDMVDWREPALMKLKTINFLITHEMFPHFPCSLDLLTCEHAVSQLKYFTSEVTSERPHLFQCKHSPISCDKHILCGCQEWLTVSVLCFLLMLGDVNYKLKELFGREAY